MITPCPKPTPRPRKPPSRLKRTALPPRSKPIAHKARPRPFRKGEAASLRRKAWDLVRKIVRSRAGHRCERCGYSSTLNEAEWLDPAHVLSRGSWPSMRLSLRNVRALCRRCHNEIGSAQTDITKPCRFRAWFIPKFGVDEWHALLAEARGPRAERPTPRERYEVAVAEARRLGIAV